MATPRTLPLGTLLKRSRVATGLTQEELADRTGVAYNMPSAFRIEGRLDCDRLAAALGQLIQTRPILRTVYRVEDGVLRQRILPGCLRRRSKP